jgi:penicillin G amidase
MRRAIIVVLACSLLLPAGLLAQASADPVDVPWLEGPARVDRDANGIAHIRAGSRHDLFLLQGWVHAQDRLFQMDVRRRQAEDTLAELLGMAETLRGMADAADLDLRRIAGAARAALGDPGFDRAYRRGAARPRDEVLAELAAEVSSGAGTPAGPAAPPPLR